VKGGPFTNLIRLRLNGILLCEATGYRLHGEEMNDGKPRRKSNINRVYALPEEQAAIEEQARKTGMSISAYLRTVGIGTPVKAVIDRELIAELGRISADQGRLGGLLKLWLSEKDKSRGMETDVRRVLRDIEEAQRRFLTVLDTL
jgi:hypothetical protein